MLVSEQRSNVLISQQGLFIRLHFDKFKMSLSKMKLHT